MTPLEVRLPAPFMVTKNPPLAIAPLRVKAVAATPMVLADPSVMAPAKELVPLLLVSAPTPPTPLPLSVTASVVL